MEHENSKMPLELAADNGSSSQPAQQILQPDLARPEESFPSHLVHREMERPAPLQYAIQDSSAAKILPRSDPLYVTPLKGLQEQSAWIDCPFCRERTQTRVETESSSMTMVAAVLCCLVSCIGAILPFICGCCEDVDHYCTKCGNRVTHQPHDGPIQIMEGGVATAMQPSKYAVANQQPSNQQPSSQQFSNQQYINQHSINQQSAAPPPYGST